MLVPLFSSAVIVHKPILQREKLKTTDASLILPNVTGKTIEGVSVVNR